MRSSTASPTTPMARHRTFLQEHPRHAQPSASHRAFWRRLVERPIQLKALSDEPEPSIGVEGAFDWRGRGARSSVGRPTASSADLTYTSTSATLTLPRASIAHIDVHPRFPPPSQISTVLTQPGATHPEWIPPPSSPSHRPSGPSRPVAPIGARFKKALGWS
jgi:hypothetical protein